MCINPKIETMNITNELTDKIIYIGLYSLEQLSTTANGHLFYKHIEMIWNFKTIDRRGLNARAFKHEYILLKHQCRSLKLHSAFDIYYSSVDISM